MPTIHNSNPAEYFRVVHPLDDQPEEKCTSEGLGPIAMTPAVRFSLVALRGYLILMGGILAYHVLAMLGFVR